MSPCRRCVVLLCLIDLADRSAPNRQSDLHINTGKCSSSETIALLTKMVYKDEILTIDVSRQVSLHQ